MMRAIIIAMNWNCLLAEISVVTRFCCSIDESTIAVLFFFSIKLTKPHKTRSPRNKHDLCERKAHRTVAIIIIIGNGRTTPVMSPGLDTVGPTLHIRKPFNSLRNFNLIFDRTLSISMAWHLFVWPVDHCGLCIGVMRLWLSQWIGIMYCIPINHNFCYWNIFDNRKSIAVFLFWWL